MSVAFSACGEVLVWSGRPRPLPLTLNLTFVSLPEKMKSISDLDTPKM